eukprot:TRINITY_DN56731_c0_g1_i1.p1 TRINITY_DN56731_c0_g1~~TRINITY_DN56731_c0_g1_i1.p1  ORF type:complete len:366 (+),score=34.31 TRINITY_DN56731_c0_g1_i1:81-1178(+)
MDAVELKLPCLDDTYLAAKSWGDSATAARLVLCIHGSLDNAASFDGLGAALARNGCLVVAVDLFGHGRSPKAPGGIYGSDVWALGVLDALASVEWNGQLVLVGHSMGTSICTLVAGALASNRQEKRFQLTHVIMLDGYGYDPFVRDSDQSNSSRKFYERSKLLRRGIRRRFEDKKIFDSLDHAVSRRMEKNVGGQPITRSAASAIVQRGSSVDATSGECSFAHDVPQLMFSASAPFLPSAESLEGYYRVFPSTLFIIAHSPVSGIPYWHGVWEGALARARWCRRASVVRVSGYHHWHADHAEECATVIVQFLSGAYLQAGRLDADSVDPAQYNADRAAQEIAVVEQIEPQQATVKKEGKKLHSKL